MSGQKGGPVECRAGHGIVVFPPDLVLGARLTHNELVFRRASCVATGIDDQRASRSDPTFAATDGLLVEFSFAQIGVQRSKIAELNDVSVGPGATLDYFEAR